MEGKRTQSERTEATRRALLDAARELFAEHGFAATGTQEIVQRAGVTRGALYHHFPDKEGLFRAVYADLQTAMCGRIIEKALAAPTPFEQLLAGIGAVLDACMEPAMNRICLIDAPAVLGWEEWRRLDEEHGLGLVRAALVHAMEAGAIARQPVDPLAHILHGAVHEAASVVAKAPDQAAAREDAGRVLSALVNGLRAETAAATGGQPPR